MSAYAQPTHSFFAEVKNSVSVFHRTKNRVRRRTFYLKDHLEKVTNIWKQSVFYKLIQNSFSNYSFHFEIKIIIVIFNIPCVYKCQTRF